MEEFKEYVSLEKVLYEYEIEDVEDEFITLQDADAVAMACCNKDPFACWTQM